MASGLSFCFSSPPHPTPNPWQRTTTNYYTPQQPSKTNWSSAFAPPSPSPLRTSRNANLMSSPTQGGDIFPKHTAPDQRDENTLSAEYASTTPITQADQVQPTTFSHGASDFSTLVSPATIPPTPSFTFTTSSTSTENIFAPTLPSVDKPLFQFSDRARSSSPSALLQSHTRENRDSRKRLFLDRLRTRRDESRSERLSDQVLRMDFLRERRMWEAEMEAQHQGLDLDVDTMSDELEEELSPSEEKEMEELVEGYYSMQREQMQRDEEFSDDGYDEAFMEVLSQEGPGESRVANNMHVSVGVSGHGVAFGGMLNSPNTQGLGPVDSEMDLS